MRGKAGARLTTLLLAAAMLLGLVTAVSADEEDTGGGHYTPTNSYVLNFGGHQDVTYVYAQFSPFVPKLTYDGGTVDGYSIIFGLYDEYNERAFERLYCTDMPVDADDSGINYRRLNLSDSTYAAQLANKLRAIVMSTYPYKTVDQVAAASGIAGLTRGEAITASQLAIWKTAHGSAVEITDFLSWTTTGNSRDSAIQRELKSEKDAYDSGDDAFKAAVKGRIEALYNYLMALPERSASSVVVSESSFVDKSTEPTITPNEGGDSCNVSVYATVDVQLNADALALTAYMDDGNYYTTTEPLRNGSNRYDLTIEDVPAEIADGAVTLAIDGVQNAGDDVFLIDADGIRGVSQSMIGVYSGALPVHAQTKAEPDRVLEIYKKTTAGVPLADIHFEIYRVCSLAEYQNGTVSIGAKPTAEQISTYAKTSNLFGTLTTDQNGYASLNFGTENDGVYLVKELDDDRVVAPVDPFFVVLPDWSRDDKTLGIRPAYTITAYPKNKLASGSIGIVKVDADNGEKLLSGAEFAVYREATAAELTSETDYIEMQVGEVTRKLIRVSFYLDEGLNREADTLTTDENGAGHIYGLAYGEYYLVELKAPDGYNKLREPQLFTVNASSNNAESTLTVENTSGVELPNTGGIGAESCAMMGALLALSSAALLLLLLRRRGKTA